jgi:integrase
MDAAKANRRSHRDSTMILLAFRNGLRAAELVTPRWGQVDLGHGKLHVDRAKNGLPSVHPLSGAKVRARPLQRESTKSPFVFVGELARFKFGVHPDMLRHACGFKFVNDGVDTRRLQAHMGHKNVQHRALYRAVARPVQGIFGKTDAHQKHPRRQAPRPRRAHSRTDPA